jgi:hypothetical protein
MKPNPLLIALLLLVPTAALAKGRVVDCAITSLPGNAVQFKGKCTFLPEAGGSFTLMDAKGRDTFYGSIGMVSVTLTGKDMAEVSGLVVDAGGAHNSRWGAATRSKTDGACWDGTDFRICAW